MIAPQRGRGLLIPSSREAKSTPTQIVVPTPRPQRRSGRRSRSLGSSRIRQVEADASPPQPAYRRAGPHRAREWRQGVRERVRIRINASMWREPLPLRAEKIGASSAPPPLRGRSAARERGREERSRAERAKETCWQARRLRPPPSRPRPAASGVLPLKGGGARRACATCVSHRFPTLPHSRLSRKGRGEMER
jgi:hypothetical protein